MLQLLEALLDLLRGLVSAPLWLIRGFGSIGSRFPNLLRLAVALIQGSALASGACKAARWVVDNPLWGALVGFAIALPVVAIALAMVFCYPDDSTNPVLEGKPPHEHVAAYVTGVAVYVAGAGLFLLCRYLYLRRRKPDDEN